jgi:hypothetical protein
VVLGSDEAAGSGALAWHVKVNADTLIVLHDNEK